MKFLKELIKIFSNEVKTNKIQEAIDETSPNFFLVNSALNLIVENFLPHIFLPKNLLFYLLCILMEIKLFKYKKVT